MCALDSPSEGDVEGRRRAEGHREEARRLLHLLPGERPSLRAGVRVHLPRLDHGQGVRARSVGSRADQLPTVGNREENVSEASNGKNIFLSFSKKQKKKNTGI